MIGREIGGEICFSARLLFSAGALARCNGTLLGHVVGERAGQIGPALVAAMRRHHFQERLDVAGAALVLLAQVRRDVAHDLARDIRL